MKIFEAEKLAENLSTMLQEKGTVGYKIARNLRMINDELKEYYELKQELFKKYGTEDGDRIIINKDSQNYPLFINEITPLMNQEVNFDFRKISEEEMEASTLTAEQMYLLKDLEE